MADAASVKDLIRRALVMNTLSFFAPAMIGHASIYNAVLREYDDPAATVGFGRKDGTEHRRRLRDDLTAVRAHPAAGRQFTLPLLAGALSAVIITVEDELKRADLRDPAKPERELLRHLRNACAHGNTFHFTHGEPKHPASFKTFALEASMHGKVNVLFDYIYPGDVYDLLEAIAATL